MMNTAIIMNNQKEKFFVENFICERYKERIAFELKSKKKRLFAIMRFCHDAPTLLNETRIVKVGSFIDDDILQAIKCKKSYVLSYGYIDGQELCFEQVLNYCNEEDLSVILIYDNIVIVKSENGKKGALYYTLKL